MTTAITVNAQFKLRYRYYFLYALCVATTLHVTALLIVPGLTEPTIPPAIIVDVPPIPIEYIIPPPPEEVFKPAPPVEAVLPEVDDNVTIPVTVLKPELPIITSDRDLWVTPKFTYRDVEPRLTRHSVVYPELLRKVGIEGKVILWLLINEQGKVEKVIVHSSSGNVGLDDAAVKGYENAIFSPALNGDIPVKVWVKQLVSFRIK